jgi:hypothetical protein
MEMPQLRSWMFAKTQIPANAVVCLSDGELSTTDTKTVRGNWLHLQPALIICPVSEPRAANLRETLRRTFLAVLLSVLGAAILAFGADFAVFRMRVATNRNPYGSVVVSHYYAVVQKNGKTQFIFDPPQPQSCVHALFPHAGQQPCWYLSRHPEQRTDI